MARAEWCGGYEATQLWVDKCLRRDGSLFSADSTREVWTLDNLEALKERFDEASKEKGKTFVEQLLDQIEGASADQIQLASEIFFVQQLGEGDTGGDRKRENIGEILSAASGTDPIPPELEGAISERGVATYGAQKSNRSAFVSLIVNLTVDLKSRDEAEIGRILDSPMVFLELVRESQAGNDGIQANSLLHLMYPDEFEYMISARQQDQLIKAFAGLPEVAKAGASKEEKIQAIRVRSDRTLERETQLYERPMRPIWMDGTSARWDEAVKWGQLFYSDPKFDEKERDYKLKLASRLSEVRAELRSGSDEWLPKLISAFRSGDNNLVHFQQGLKFTNWCEADPGGAAQLVGELWETPDTAEALEAFLANVPPEASSGPGMKLSLSTFLLLAVSPTSVPFYKRTLHQKFRTLVGADEEAARTSEEAVDDDPLIEMITTERVDDRTQELTLFDDWVLLLEELRLRMLAKGHELRDLLDAQGIAYSLLEGETPADWTDDQVKSFGFFRDSEEANRPADEIAEVPPHTASVLPEATAEVASKTFLPQDWLQNEILDLLEEKKQIVFYGPPGTGKTLVSQRIGELIVEAGGESRLVQFHPSYTYEDFFEGYRPVGSAGGSIEFRLVPGPLKELAEEARKHPGRPYLLIIDEINRGNIAKIFGELFFLLEYRNQEIELQYSQHGEQFSIPENLFFIGTMNTADRSIALVDNAMRRRFYFVGFDPLRKPIKDVLPRWLERHGLEPKPALLLEALNEKIGDRDFSIGPSYLMNRDGSTPDLDRAWKHSVGPLLEEHFYGGGRDVEAEFSFKVLETELAAQADQEASTDDSVD